MNETIYEPPKSMLKAHYSIEKVGNQFRIQEPGKLPSICVGCGANENLIHDKNNLTYVNPMIFLWVFLSPLALIIAYYVYRKNVNIAFERCGSCDKKKTLWSNIAIASWLGFIISIMIRVQIEGSLWIALCVFGFLLFALFASTMKDPGFSVKSHTEPHFYLKGFKKVVASKL